jgi:hypothetical protein
MGRRILRHLICLAAATVSLAGCAVGSVSESSEDEDQAAIVGASCPEKHIASVSASANDGNVPANVLDGRLRTRWSAWGSGSYITADLGAPLSACGLGIAWYLGSQRSYNFVISVSSDGSGFSQVYSGTSSGTTSHAELYSFPSVQARFLRVTVNGNNQNESAGITELHVFASHGGSGIDAGAIDAGAIDAGAIDAGAIDAGAIDAGDAGGTTGAGGFVISVPLALDKSTVTAGNTLHGTVTYKNTSAAPITVNEIVIGGRPPGGQNAGGPYEDLAPNIAPTTVQPGATITLSSSRAFTSADPVGQWYTFATYEDALGGWHDGPSVFFQVANSQADAGVANTDASVITPPPTVAPTITAQPQDQLVTVGQTATFSVAATGTAPLSFQWQKSGTAISGATSATYSTPVTTLADSGTTFSLKVSNSAGSVTSQTAKLTVSSGTSTPPSSSQRYVGVNLGWVNSTHPDQIFANAAKHARPWTLAGGDTVAPLGPDGWPSVGDVRLGISEGRGQPCVPGYALRFRGSATSIAGAEVSITNVSFDGTWTTADVAITDSPAYIEVHGAKRPNGSPGLADLTLMRPGHDRNVNYFNKDFVGAIGPISIFRAMQAGGPGFDNWGITGAVGVMGNRDTTWSSRQRPGVGYAYNGPAWEDWILLANLLHKDLWLNIPFHVDADYVRKLGYLLRYGSDGATGEPFTSQTYDPATWAPATTAWYPGLAPGRRIYIEYANELWNSGFGYPNSDEVPIIYENEVNAGDIHHLSWDGQGTTDRWVGWKTVWISNLLREAWGSEMQNTIRMVLPTQGGWGNWDRANSALQYIDHVWGASSPWNTIDGMANPKQPVKYYIRTVAGSFYINWSGLVNVTNADSAFQSMYGSLNGPNDDNNTVKERMDFGEARASQYGLTFSCYEGGTEIYDGLPSDWKSWWFSDPRMSALLSEEMLYFYSKPHAEVWLHFMMLSDGMLGTSGLSLDYSDLNTQRWQAFRTVAGQ